MTFFSLALTLNGFDSDTPLVYVPIKPASVVTDGTACDALESRQPRTLEDYIRKGETDGVRNSLLSLSGLPSQSYQASALLLAVSLHQTEALSLMLLAGFDPNSVSKLKIVYGVKKPYISKRIVMVYCLSPEAMRQLLLAGGKPSLTNEDKQTIAHFYAQHTTVKDGRELMIAARILVLLELAGADFQAKDYRGRTVHDYISDDPRLLPAIDKARGWLRGQPADYEQVWKRVDQLVVD